MKMFVVLALAAAAVAEPEAAADAQYISAYGAYHPYTTTYGALPYTRSYGVYGGAYSSPLMSALSYTHYGKREAEADPALVYSNAYPYTTTYAAAAYLTAMLPPPLSEMLPPPLSELLLSPLSTLLPPTLSPLLPVTLSPATTTPTTTPLCPMVSMAQNMLPRMVQ